ncbi:hypothetical protein FSARC_3013 [Fusarium sarcochroum]|uniref:Uncharacterized protein n=1 Tax=Fusarium sarcochroum TaxID=1208366 RepID=A0A8H4U4Q2_9HYPO|nr:hypothetical protein FSARC_3013 [Fusarium sarcochroum]
MSQHRKRRWFSDNNGDDTSPAKRSQTPALDDDVSATPFSPGSSMDLDMPNETDSVRDVSVFEGDQLERICYGAVCGVHILMSSKTQKPDDALPWTRYCLFDIERRDGACYLSGDKDAKTKELSVLDCHTARILINSDTTVDDLSFTAVLGVEVLHAKRGEASGKRSPIEATVNIYGPRSSMGQVDQVLSEMNAYLQHPVFLEPGIPYVNPQYLYPNHQKTDLRHLIGPAPKKVKTDTSRAIDDALESLDAWVDGSPTRFEVTHLGDVLNSFLIDTRLKEHQLQGIDFILTREDSDAIAQTHQKMLATIHHSLFSHESLPGRGGILADVMGLGKTLTMLSAILCSKQLFSSPGQVNGLSSRSDPERQSPNLTLVVLPSRQVLDVWQNEIDRRFRPQALKTTIFHGSKRAKEGQSLLDDDIVLTTYHTLEKDNRGCKVLKSIKWSRIVLDEAHQIRNSSIKLFKAAASLQSETRWCITGTPIQNSFDDLRSLLQFLRFEPFCQNKVFEEHIIKPFRPNQSCGVDPSRNLRIMLKTCCLRRTQTKLNLPSVTTQKVMVTPTDAEKATFTQILEQCREEFDRIAGKDAGSKKPNVLFSAIMKLRRVCNHGIIPIDVGSTKRSNQLAVPRTPKNGSRSPSAEPGCDFCSGKNQDTILETLDSCPLCGRLRPGRNGEMYDLILSPQHLSPISSASTPTSEMETSGFVTNTFVDLPSSNELMEQSSKMSAVIDNIKKSCLDAYSKSVVFSSWRDTLDILARMLFANGIGFMQVDGRNPLTGRTELLSRFRKNPNVRVLLISINTGAVGLTLTEANMVHIVEPQWNPSIEDQAIARIVRMGQTRPVTIFKYTTTGSVEQTVVKLQEKKTRIIKLSMQDKDDTDSDMNLDSFKFAIDPNEWE